VRIETPGGPGDDCNALCQSGGYVCNDGWGDYENTRCPVAGEIKSFGCSTGDHSTFICSCMCKEVLVATTGIPTTPITVTTTEDRAITTKNKFDFRVSNTNGQIELNIKVTGSLIEADSEKFYLDNSDNTLKKLPFNKIMSFSNGRSDGPAKFPKRSWYKVEIKKQPTNEICRIVNANQGSITTDTVIDIQCQDSNCVPNGKLGRGPTFSSQKSNFNVGNSTIHFAFEFQSYFQITKITHQGKTNVDENLTNWKSSTANCMSTMTADVDFGKLKKQNLLSCKDENHCGGFFKC